MNLIPYIIFDGECEEAFNFYAKALGGKIEFIQKWGGSPAEKMAVNKDWILHATLDAKGMKIQGSDRGKDAPPPPKEGMILLSINFDNEQEEEKIFKAMGEGGEITMPLQDTFWGAKFGMIKDKFGIGWMFNCEKKK